MKLISEKCGCRYPDYYYMVELTYETEDGRKIVGLDGFDGGLLGMPGFDDAKAKARARAEADALEQLRGTTP